MYKINLEKPLSFSAMTKYMNCPREWWFHYMSEHEGEEEYSVYRDTGTLVHAGIAKVLAPENFGKDPNLRLRSGIDEITSMEEYSAKDRQRAMRLLMAYAGPGSLIQQLRPTSLVEVDFEYGLGPIMVKGVLDAVVEWEDKLVLIDWKVRSRFYSVEAVRNDLQLYLYSWVLEHKYNMKIDYAVQYNMSFNGPSYPRLRKDGEINESLGKTTEELMRSALDQYGIEGERRDEIMNQFRHKYVSIDEFLYPVQVHMDNRQHYIDVIETLAHNIYNDEEFLPLYSTYKCNSCSYIRDCRKMAVDS